MADAVEAFDVIIVGGGVSGIGTAYRVGELCPSKSLVVLEGREDLGGTWDLWRYPGVRSDSDMYTFAYPFDPWKSTEALVDGPKIKKYLQSVASRHGIREKMRFGCHVQQAEYQSLDAKWFLNTSKGRFSCKYLYLCSGYYKYDGGYVPEYPGASSYTGRVVHPMHWPEDLDVSGKRVVVVGSGATAISLAPKLSETAAHVTLLQRSPSYLVAMPRHEHVVHRPFHRLAPTMASRAARLRHMSFAMFGFKMAQTFPEKIKAMLIDDVKKAMPKQDARHFIPKYKPWDQRICGVADGDLFEAVNEGRVTFVTDHIEEFVPTGIRLKSGGVLEADLIVSATGFNLQPNYPMSSIEVAVDGKPYVASEAVIYRGVMLSGVPNFGFSLGYINASWTLRSDLSACFFCRLINHMDQHGHREVRPRLPDTPLPGLRQSLTLTSGYVARMQNSMPSISDEVPWNTSLYHVMSARELGGCSLVDRSLQYDGGSVPQSRL